MRSHWCGELRPSHSGEEAHLAGWIQRRRDHGGVIFLDVRDRSGLVQVVASPEDRESYAAAEKVRPEYVVMVAGTVRERPQDKANPALATGEIEVAAKSIEILAESETPPFQIEDWIDVSEETRIRYRYLDLRRPEMQRMIMLRHKVVSAIRAHFNEEGFIEIETPMVTKATPEGARDFLVPSRLEPGKFFALPQSPQLFKQLLMIAGFDRYYQIARCFRDEDPRSDRQPDFTQLDMEMSFVDEETIIDITERMFVRIFKDALGMELKIPFPRMTYDEAYARYGSDKPDLRFGLEITDISKVFEGTQIRIFQALASGGAAKCIVVPGQSVPEGMSRKQLDALVGVARNSGAGGLAWIQLESGGYSSPVGSALKEKEVEDVREATGAGDGDLVLIVCDKPRVAEFSLGSVRLELADLLNLRPELPDDDPRGYMFTWVMEPPLVEWNEKESRWDPVHHPFTAPREQDEALIESDPEAVRARCYDVVLNGWEMGTGSIRIHRPELQRRVFDLIGIPPEEAERRFGWFLKAFEYGAPPHGGIAPGIDRIVSRILHKDQIRDSIAFPKTGAYTDPLTGAPDYLDDEQLKELRIKTLPPPPSASGSS